MNTELVQHQEEESLILLVKNGSVAAFGQLSTRYYRPLFDYGRKFSNDRELIKDLIQDVLLQLWQRRDQIDPTANLRLYLLKTLRNRLYKEYHKHAPIRSTGHVEVCFDLTTDESIEDRLIADESNAELLTRLRLHLQKLPKRQQESLFLKFHADLNNDQIAEVMGINRQSVANLLYNGLRQLKDNFVLLVFFTLV